jgi:phage protein D
LIDENWIDIKLGDLKVDANWRGYLESVTVVDNTDGHSGITVQFSLPGVEGAKLAVDIGKKVYAKTYEVTLKEGTSDVRTFVGDIVSFSWDRSGTSPRRVTITGKDQLHRLRRTNPKVKPDGRMLVGKKASEIVKVVADDWGFASNIEATDGVEDKVYSSCTDLELLQDMAKRVGYVVCLGVKGKKPELLFKRREKWNDKPITLTYGVDIVSVNGSHDYSSCWPEVKMTATDQQSLDEFEGKSTVDDVDKTNGSSDWTGAGLAKTAGWYGIIKHEKGSEASTQPLIKGRAKAEMVRAAEQFFRGSVSCEFNPNMQPGAVVEIKDAGWPFDGKFSVKKVTHKLSASGYTTEAELGATSIKKPA